MEPMNSEDIVTRR